MYQAENVTVEVPYTVIFSGKKIYRYLARTSESDVLLKSVIPGMPAYFLHDCTSGMFNLCYLYVHSHCCHWWKFSLNVCIYFQCYGEFNFCDHYRKPSQFVGLRVLKIPVYVETSVYRVKTLWEIWVWENQKHNFIACKLCNVQ